MGARTYAHPGTFPPPPRLHNLGEPSRGFPTFCLASTQDVLPERNFRGDLCTSLAQLTAAAGIPQKRAGHSVSACPLGMPKTWTPQAERFACTLPPRVIQSADHSRHPDRPSRKSRRIFKLLRFSCSARVVTCPPYTSVAPSKLRADSRDSLQQSVRFQSAICCSKSPADRLQTSAAPEILGVMTVFRRKDRWCCPRPHYQRCRQTLRYLSCCLTQGDV